MDVTGIPEFMAIYCFCGDYVGAVERMEGGTIRLCSEASWSGGRSHFVPLACVETLGGQLT